MRMIKSLAAISLLLVGCMVSYQVGRSERTTQNRKDYQAACILSDCCRNMIDNLGVDAEEIYYEYVDNLDCYGNIIVTKEDMKNYYWCY